MKIKELPNEDKPREKMMKHGSGHLSNSELLAIILRTGMKGENVITLSTKIFQKYNLSNLAKLNLSNLKKVKGIGTAKGCQILSCFELGKRLSAFTDLKKPKIKNAEDLSKILIPQLSSKKQEELHGIFLNTRNEIIKRQSIFKGSLNEALIHPREIFKIALEENAAAIILAHNHPSGDCRASLHDIEATKEIHKAGKMMGIELLDHIIIGGNNYTSMKEEGEF